MNDLQEFATSIITQISYIRDELKSAIDAATLDKAREHLNQMDIQTSIMLKFATQAAGITPEA
jgi:hypothetical protein